MNAYDAQVPETSTRITEIRARLLALGPVKYGREYRADEYERRALRSEKNHLVHQGLTGASFGPHLNQ